LLCAVYVGEIPDLLYVLTAEKAYVEVGNDPKKE
jgi:hypothetical protein